MQGIIGGVVECELCVLFNYGATTEISTSLFVGSVRCVEETGMGSGCVWGQGVYGVRVCMGSGCV